MRGTHSPIQVHWTTAHRCGQPSTRTLLSGLQLEELKLKSNRVHMQETPLVSRSVGQSPAQYVPHLGGGQHFLRAAASPCVSYSWCFTAASPASPRQPIGSFLLSANRVMGLRTRFLVGREKNQEDNSE